MGYKVVRVSGQFESGTHHPIVPEMNDLNPKYKLSVSVRQKEMHSIAGRA